MSTSSAPSGHGALQAVTDASFATDIAPGSGLVLLEFTAAWCAPCRMMASILVSIADEYAGRLRVMQTDADSNVATMTRLGIRGLPTMLLFRDGEEVERIIGAMPAPRLRERLAPYVTT
jgi:thioredoxin 1